MSNNKILYICPEVTPYLPETHISIICRYLPQIIQDGGREVRVFMPRYGSINERRNQLHEVIRLSGMNLIIDDTDHQLIIKVASIPGARLQIYFIDSEDFFGRKSIFADDQGNYFSDNDERAMFFVRGVLETVKKLRWSPGIVHCHGWFSMFAPIYLKKIFKDDPIFAKSKVVYSIYKDDFEGELSENLKQKLRQDGIKPTDVALLDNPNYLNASKFALQYSDAVVIAEENINSELESHIKTLEKPLLSHTEKENFTPAYSDFYDSIL